MKSKIPKLFLFLLIYIIGNSVVAQITVSGTVSDAIGPIPGVNIIVRGTSMGSVSDFDGKYSIDNVPEDGTLIFSFVGFISQQINVNGQTTIDLTMKEDAAALEEVVVIGYGSIRAKDATGAVASVKAEDFNSGVISSPEQLIQGKLAGVQITQTSGEPGAGINLRIRGTSSVRANNNPLYVVDGFPLNSGNVSAGTGGSDIGNASAKNPLNFLNPNDIGSIDILKDASATAIYGSRGANGVVLITTKQAKMGKPLLEFSTSVSSSRITQKLDLLGREEYLKIQSALGADLSVVDQGGNTDWQDLILRDAFSSNYNVAFGNANENGFFRFSANYDDQEGILENTSLTRLTARVNGKYSFYDDKLKIETQMTISDVDDNRAPLADNANARGDLLSSAFYSNPTLPAFDSDGNPTRTGSVEQINPLGLLKYTRDVTNTFRTLTNLSAQYSFSDNLSFKTLVGFDKTVSKRAGAFSRLLEVTGVDQIGRAQINELNTTTALWENYFNYNKEFGKHSLDAILGYSYQTFKTETDDLVAAKFSYDEIDLMLNNIGNAEIFAANTSNFTDELQSYFGRVQYSYASKYLLTATLRADGSTKFGPNKKYGYFPSFAAAWRLSEEDFIPSAFSDLKLRAGYGVTGNQEIPGNVYSQRGRFNIDQIDNQGNLQPAGFGFITFDNPDLQWEETSQLNIGLDYGFLNNRISGSIDLYRKVTTDLLIQEESNSPATNDFNWQNLDADVINQGIEFLINVDVVNTENFGWNSSFNIAYNQNKVENFGNGFINTGQIDGPGLTGAFAQRIADDRPLYSYYMRIFTGFDADGFSTYEGGVDNIVFTGDSPLPDVTLGFSNSFSYKNFDLSLYINGQFGQEIYNNNANALFTFANLNQGRNVTSDVGELVQIDGNGNLLKTLENPANSADVSTRFLEDGSFLRLQSATLTYNFDMTNIKWMEALRLYVSGQNLFVLTNYSGQDPEVSTNKQINNVPSAGIDYTAYPRARTFSLGLNATF